MTAPGREAAGPYNDHSRCGPRCVAVPPPVEGRKPTETTHDCPRDGEAVTLCCGRSPFELPRTDRMTVEAALVTCTGRRRA